MSSLGKSSIISKTGLELPRFGLGAAHISEGSTENAIEIVHAAYDRGIRLFDTSPIYGYGKSEGHLGEALAGIKRESYIMSSKVGRLILPDGSACHDFGKDIILTSLEQSLKKLKTDYLDILHIHDPDNHYQQALTEAVPLLEDLRQQGVIKAIGVGMNQWQMLAEFAHHADLNCFLLAGRFSLLEQDALAFLNLCQEKGISLILGGIYNSGILASDLSTPTTYNYKPAPKHLLDKAQKIASICNEFNVPLNVAAIHFPYLHKAVSSVVVGAQSAKEVKANLDGLKVAVPIELWQALKEEGLISLSASDELN